MSKIAFKSMLILVMAYLGLACAGYLDNLRGPYFPEILSDLKLRDDVGALFFSFASLFAFLASPVFDFFKRHFSVVQIWSAGVFFMASGFFLMAHSSNTTLLFICAMMFGLGFGTVSIGQNLMVFENASKNSRRQLFSGLHSMYAMASLASPLVAAYFMRENIEWREAFSVSSAVPFLLFIGSIFLLFQKAPRKLADVPEVNPHIFVSHRKLAWLWAFINAFYLFAEISISSRLVLYLNRHQGFNLVEATQYLTGFFLAMWIGRTLFTVCHFRRITTWQILVAGHITAAICITLGLLWHPIWLSISGFCLAPLFPFMMEYISHIFGEHCQKPISFVVGFGSLSVVVMHLIVGVISEQWSLQDALWIGPLGLLLSLSLMYASSRLTARSQH